jgi:acyl-CoA thioesterase-1
MALVIALGGNDGLRGVSPEQTASNLAGIIKRAREKAPGIVVLLAGMEMPGNFGEEYTTAFRAVFPRVASENGAVLIPFLLEGVGGIAELNQADAIHPNATGQQRIAETLWPILQKALPH